LISISLQFNNKSSLTKSLADAFQSANFDYAIVFSGTDSDGLRNTQSLNHGTTLTTIGEAFKKAIK